jgi:hypothetical protein
MSRPSGRSAARIAGPVSGVVGLFVLVAGTFLPWLSSGQARRNSYQTGGALRRLLGLHGVLEACVSAWPFVGLVCAAVVVLFAGGLRRWAAVLGLLTALATGAVAIAALRVDSTFFVRPERFGPAVTLAGAAVLLVGASVQLISAGLLGASRRSTS